MKKLIEKYKDILAYLIFGVLTTAVNIVSYWILAHPLRIQIMPSTIMAWIISVSFAYITNRSWVFHSTAKSIHEILREMFGFFSCRLATGFIDWGCMLIFVDFMHCQDLFIKCMANILVIVLNYIASKLLIFRK